MSEEYNKFEKARIVGARALQIAMGAPLLIKRPVKEYNPINIAFLEFKKKVLPITIRKE
ncbi:MAG: DNA-directed RNA polymerase subunit K [Nanoarchaeota archaeon]|nr:DNA-directed RNA polymerase subunit K [Nanoarchaeota archaeon]